MCYFRDNIALFKRVQENRKGTFTLFIAQFPYWHRSKAVIKKLLHLFQFLNQRNFKGVNFFVGTLNFYSEI